MKKKAMILLLFLGFCLSSHGQEFKKLDSSPLDIVSLKETQQSKALIKICYSRPQKKGRVLFGELIPYNKVWRLGANEATEIRFAQDVVFGTKKIVAGTYTMYAIPTETTWTIIINHRIDAWGSFVYDKKYDVARITVPVIKTIIPREVFSMAFETKRRIRQRGIKRPLKKTILYITWDTTLIKIPIEL